MSSFCGDKEWIWQKATTTCAIPVYSATQQLNNALLLVPTSHIRNGVLSLSNTYFPSSSQHRPIHAHTHFPLPPFALSLPLTRPWKGRCTPSTESSVDIGKFAVYNRERRERGSSSSSKKKGETFWFWKVMRPPPRHSLGSLRDTARNSFNLCFSGTEKIAFSLSFLPFPPAAGMSGN